jgi:nicotinate-nucleotide--dimethylbenzimidazole phosphoribosyltransferase
LTDAATNPLSDIKSLIERMPAMDAGLEAATAGRVRGLEVAPGALGRMPELAGWLSGWQGKETPSVRRPSLVVFASSHGIAAQGITRFSVEGARATLEGLAAGNEGLNGLVRSVGMGLKVLDLAIDHPTPDISVEPAFTPRDVAATIAFGMEALVETPDILALGDIGAGNGVIAAATACALFGGAPKFWVGPVLGGDDGLMERRVELIAQAMDTHRGHLGDPLEVLRRLGGREIAAMVGAIIAARHQKVPVLLDGMTSIVAAAVLDAVRPGAADHCVCASTTGDRAHLAVLERLRMQPLIDWQIRTGDGTGAALAVPMLRAVADLASPPAAAT